MKLVYTLFLNCLLGSLPLFLNAQLSPADLTDWNESSTMYVKATTEAGEKTEYTYKAQEIAQFDLAKILRDHRDEVVMVYGSSLINDILVYYRFDSRKDDTYAPCGNFVPMMDCEGDQAFLGVKVEADDTKAGAVVVQVRPNTAAEASDLVNGDLIKSVDTADIVEFTDLSKQIRARKIGQTIMMTVNRGGEILEIPATLGTRAHQTVRFIPNCESAKNGQFVTDALDTSSSVYPNPTNGPLTWNVTGLNDTPTSFTLSDIGGKVLVRQTVLPFNNSLSHKLDVSNLVKGAYLLHLQQDNLVVEEKVLVVH